jgi:phage host-nuclease inhibitor protein Gam
MKKTRIRSSKQEVITREQAEMYVTKLAIETNCQRSLTAKQDAEILAIREKYESDLWVSEESIKIYSDKVQLWAEQNPDEFAKKKSVDFSAGKVGFRTGTPKLKAISGLTLAGALNILKSLSWGRAFVRVKEELDKESILAQFSQGNLSKKELLEIGCKVEQEETFFIEPDLTPFENRVSKEAA